MLSTVLELTVMPFIRGYLPAKMESGWMPVWLLRAAVMIAKLVILRAWKASVSQHIEDNTLIEDVW